MSAEYKSVNHLNLNNPREVLEYALRKIEGAYSDNTIRAYRADFFEYIKYCELKGLNCVPASPDVLAAFTDFCAAQEISVNTIKRKLSAISAIHKFCRMPDLAKDIDVRLAMRRMVRKKGSAHRQAYGLNQKMFDDLIGKTGNDLRGVRDRALLYLGYCTLCRRAELVALLIQDIKINDDGSALIHQRTSKTDIGRLGRWIFIPKEVYSYIKQWIEFSKLDKGPILRGVDRGGNVSLREMTPGNVSRIYKKLARKAGYSEELIAGLTSHSTRVGAAQELLRTGASLLQVMQRGGWRVIGLAYHQISKIYTLAMMISNHFWQLVMQRIHCDCLSITTKSIHISYRTRAESAKIIHIEPCTSIMNEMISMLPMDIYHDIACCKISRQMN